jgi:hypothetical protein
MAKRTRKSGSPDWAEITDDPLADVEALHKAAWRNAPPPATVAEAQQQHALARFQEAGVDLVHEGVTTLILEGVYLVWWVKIACASRGKGGLEVDKALSWIGALMKPIKRRMEALAATIVDDGPTPEMALLGQRMQDARDAADGGRTRPATKDEEMRQAEKAHGRLQQLLRTLIDEGIPPSVAEHMLFYYWFRVSVVNNFLQESFFQTLERNWDRVMGEVNMEMDRFASTL